MTQTATRESKLARLLRDEELARALVAAGLDTPAKIKAASDQRLLAVKGVGPATKQKIRERFPGRS